MSDDLYTHPDWLPEPFDRDMATAERWTRLDDAEARGQDRTDTLTRDAGERPGRSLTPKTERRAA